MNETQIFLNTNKYHHHTNSAEISRNIDQSQEIHPSNHSTMSPESNPIAMRYHNSSQDHDSFYLNEQHDLTSNFSQSNNMNMYNPKENVNGKMDFHYAKFIPKKPVQTYQGGQDQMYHSSRSYANLQNNSIPETTTATSQGYSTKAYEGGQYQAYNRNGVNANMKMFSPYQVDSTNETYTLPSEPEVSENSNKIHQHAPAMSSMPSYFNPLSSLLQTSSLSSLPKSTHQVPSSFYKMLAEFSKQNSNHTSSSTNQHFNPTYPTLGSVLYNQVPSQNPNLTISPRNSSISLESRNSDGNDNNTWKKKTQKRNIVIESTGEKQRPKASADEFSKHDSLSSISGQSQPKSQKISNRRKRKENKSIPKDEQALKIQRVQEMETFFKHGKKPTLYPKSCTISQGSGSGSEGNSDDDDHRKYNNGTSRRERKNDRERKRRMEVNVMFNELTAAMGLTEDTRIDKAGLLRRACSLFDGLREEIKRLEDEVTKKDKEIEDLKASDEKS